jgi:hypothetical protein
MTRFTGEFFAGFRRPQASMRGVVKIICDVRMALTTLCAANERGSCNRRWRYDGALRKDHAGNQKLRA